jgi:hypothetical protein
MVSNMQELSVVEIVEVAGAGFADDWWAMNRDVSIQNGGTLSKWDMMTAA